MENQNREEMMKMNAMIRTLGIVLVCTLLLLSAVPAAAAVISTVGQNLNQSLVQNGSFSGDDAYDPAAGGLVLPRRVSVSSYRGDDAYDPAAGRWGTPQRAIAITFSGDDAYDPAAGGLNPMTAPRYAATQQDDCRYAATQQDD